MNNPLRRDPNLWAVLLAGGDGRRLRPLTIGIEGDERPKQFCRILGERTLLADTRRRVAPLFDASRTITLVTKKHERYYRAALADAPEGTVLEQPFNRGTGAAMALAILTVRDLDDDAMVAFFPCTHHFGREAAFLRSVDAGLRAVCDHPDKIVLLGAPPNRPDVGYGWIEPAPAPVPFSLAPTRVRRFCERPPMMAAQTLFNTGCVWDTRILMGRVSAFVEVLCAAVPRAVLALSVGALTGETSSGYQDLRPVDFARDVLTAQPERLLVIRDAASRWSDLGSPSRVLDTIACEQLTPWWLARMGRTYMSRAS